MHTAEHYSALKGTEFSHLLQLHEAPIVVPCRDGMCLHSWAGARAGAGLGTSV